MRWHLIAPAEQITLSGTGDRPNSHQRQQAAAFDAASTLYMSMVPIDSRPVRFTASVYSIYGIPPFYLSGTTADHTHFNFVAARREFPAQFAFKLLLVYFCCSIFSAWRPYIGRFFL